MPYMLSIFLYAAQLIYYIIIKSQFILLKALIRRDLIIAFTNHTLGEILIEKIRKLGQLSGKNTVYYL